MSLQIEPSREAFSAQDAVFIAKMILCDLMAQQISTLLEHKVTVTFWTGIHQLLVLVCISDNLAVFVFNLDLFAAFTFGHERSVNDSQRLHY